MNNTKTLLTGKALTITEGREIFDIFGFTPFTLYQHNRKMPIKRTLADMKHYELFNFLKEKTYNGCAGANRVFYFHRNPHLIKWD